jgi:hypothetical protein
MDRNIDREWWDKLSATIDREGKRLDRSLGKLKRIKFSCVLIVKIYLWCVQHDRPQCWGASKCHYNSLFRPRALPSVSQLSRRVRSPRVQLLLGKVFQALAGQATASGMSYLDGKPLPVSPVSRDHQAARGHVSGGFAKGYKLHAWVNEDRRILRAAVMPLNQGEAPVARAILAEVPPFSGDALVLADQSYDGIELFNLLASKNAAFLPALRGIPKHPVNQRQSGPIRMEAVRTWQQATDLARYIYKDRIGVESVFGELTCTGGLLGPLPAWVRTLARVRRWVNAKIILYNARWHAKRRLACVA